MALARANGIDLYYESHGDGPPLLLIPGLPQTVPDWFPFASRLAETFRVIALDNRGSGRSDKPESWYTTPLMAADAAALLDHLEIERADVFGTSMGGMIAQELALGFPQKVRRLVLGCTTCGGRQAIGQPPEIAEAFMLETEDWALRVRRLAPYGLSERWKASHREAFEDFLARKSRDVQPFAAYRRQWGAVLRHDSYDRLPAITHPTLVITGTDDPVMPPANSELLARRIPGAELLRIDAGHLFFVEEPDRTAAALRRFLMDGVDVSSHSA